MYSLIGFSRFVSKKGNPTLILYVTFEQKGVDGAACDRIFCSPDCVSDDLYVGAELDISFTRMGYVQRVEVK